MVERRTVVGGLLATGVSSLLGGVGGTARAQALPHALRPGKPFAGQEVSVLLPNASQYRAQQKRLPEFEALTGIKLNFIYAPYGQLLDKITTEGVSGGSSYDIVTYQDSWGPSLLPYIDPLDTYLSRDGMSLDRYPEAYARASTFGGKPHGLPIRGQPQMLFYRRDLLEQAGVQPPTTWEEMTEAAQAVQSKIPGMAGIAMPYGRGNGYQNLFPWLNHLWAYGSDLLDDQRRPRFNDAGGLAATQAYVDPLLKHKVVSAGSVGFVEGDMVNSMAQGHAAMIVVWWWAYPVLAGGRSTLTPEQVGFAPAPGFRTGRQAGLGQCMPFSISKASRRKDAAWEALKWMSNPELERVVATDKSDPNTVEIIVTNKANFTDDAVNAANNGLQRVGLRSLEGARSMPQLREWPQVAAALEVAVSDIVTSGKPVKAAMDDAAAQVARIMRRSSG